MVGRSVAFNPGQLNGIRYLGTEGFQLLASDLANAVALLEQLAGSKVQFYAGLVIMGVGVGGERVGVILVNLPLFAVVFDHLLQQELWPICGQDGFRQCDRLQRFTQRWLKGLVLQLLDNLIHGGNRRVEHHELVFSTPEFAHGFGELSALNHATVNGGKPLPCFGGEGVPGVQPL